MTVYIRRDRDGKPLSPYWQVEFAHMGETVRQSSKYPHEGGAGKKADANRKKAEALEAKLRLEITERRKAGKLPTISLGNAERRYVGVRLVPKCRPAALKNEGWRAQQIIREFGSDTPLTDLTKPVIMGWYGDLIEDGRSPQTAKRLITHLRAAIRFAGEEGHAIPELGKLHLAKAEMRVRFLADEEERRFLAAFELAMRELIALFLDTGSRKSELLDATWRDVLFDNQTPRQITIGADRAKSKKGRAIPLSSRAQAVLAERRQRVHNRFDLDERIFADITPAMLRKGFDKALTETGIQDFRVHDLRHCFASKLAQRGAEITRIQQLLGHASLAMTLRYAHLMPSNLADAVKLLDAPTPRAA